MNERDSHQLQCDQTLPDFVTANDASDTVGLAPPPCNIWAEGNTNTLQMARLWCIRVYKPVYILVYLGPDQGYPEDRSREAEKKLEPTRPISLDG